MVVFVFALQIAAFSSRAFLVQLDTDFPTPENSCRKSEKVRFEHPCLNHQSLETIVLLVCPKKIWIAIKSVVQSIRIMI